MLDTLTLSAIVVTAALLLWCARSLYATTRLKHLSMSMPKLGVEADYFIPFTWKSLRHSMLESMASSHERRWVKVFFGKLDSWLNAKSHADTTRVLQDFAVFDPSVDSHEFRSGSKAVHFSPNTISYLTQEKIEQLQDRFLSNCQTMLVSAGYKPVTREELTWALGEDYLSTIPIEINWNALDNSMLRQYKEKREPAVEGTVADVGLPPESEKRENAFLPSNRVWVFRRGIGTNITKDYFIFQKLDHMITIGWGWLLERIRSMLRITPPKAQAPLQSHVPEGSSIQPLAENQPVDDDTNVIKRVTLHDEVASKGFKCLFEKSELKEATYKEVMVLYRRATPTEESLDPTETTATNNKLAIFIKLFRDIPIADLEMVFPEKRVRMRPVDRLYITATFGLGLITFALGLADELNSWLGLAAMVTFAVLAGRTFMAYRYSMIYYQSSMLSFLYDKSLDNHRGALLYLQDRLKAQELKECSVLYFFLWHGGPQSIKELGQACESFFQEMQQGKRNPLNIRFAVKDVLTKLLEWGIAVETHPVQQDKSEVSEQEDKHYGAVSPDKAISRLEQHWDSLFNSIPTSSLAPAPMSPSLPSATTPK